MTEQPRRSGRIFRAMDHVPPRQPFLIRAGSLVGAVILSVALVVLVMWLWHLWETWRSGEPEPIPVWLEHHGAP